MMKKLKKTISLFVLAALLLVTAAPLGTMSKAENKTVGNELHADKHFRFPEGYNENDCGKIAAFLEQLTGDGLKNGEKLSDNYDANDPETWGTYLAVDDMGYTTEYPRFLFENVQGELRVTHILLNDCNLSGELDLSDCTALEWLHCIGNLFTALSVSDCISLVDLECAFSAVNALDVSGCTSLENLNCTDAKLTALDISDCTSLSSLDCSANRLTQLDTSNNAQLATLRCMYNYFSELDFTSNPLLPIDAVIAVGNGTIGYQYDDGWEVNAVYASPYTDAEFTGWHDANDSFVGMGFEFEQVNGTNWSYDCSESPELSMFYAVFSGGTPPQPTMLGDVDGNGSITIADSILALRLSLGLADGEGIYPENADADGSGSVTVADAIIIARMALGIWERHE